jgi:hypothetical protein
MPTDWTDKVRNAITNLENKTDRVPEADQALAIIDDVVAGKLAAYELAIIHGVPEARIEVTLGHVTRMVQGTGRALPLDAGGWYAFQGHDTLTRWPPVSPPPGGRRAACHDRPARIFLPTSSPTTIKGSFPSKADDR